MTTVTVVVCTFSDERWPQLADALAAVERQLEPGDELVVVVDHNQALLDRCRGRWPRLRVLPNAGRRGLSDARNSGTEAARGEVVAFLDDDAVPEDGWLDRLRRHLEDEDVIGAGGDVRPDWAGGRPRWFPPEFEWVVGGSRGALPDGPATVRNVVGASMAIRRDVLLSVGGFHAGLGRVGSRPTGCEETDVFIRAGQRFPGKRVVYDPAAVVHHRVPATRATVRYFLARCAAEGRSKAALAAMVGSHDALSSERAYAARLLPRAVGREVARLAAGDAGGLLRAGAMVAGLLWTGASFAVAVPGARRAAVSPRSVDASGRPAGPRVLMVTPRYLPDAGGVERHVDEVARRMRAGGADLSVLTTDRSGRRPRFEMVGGVPVVRVRAWPRQGDLYLAPGLAREIRKSRPDIVHVQSYHTLVAPTAMLTAAVLRIPYVVTFHGGGHSAGLRRAVRPLQRRALGPLLRRAARVVSVARFEAGTYGRALAIPSERFAYIPNGVDGADASAASERSRASEREPVVATVGRLERYKGHHRVAAAFPWVLAAEPRARLLIVGTGPEETALRRQIRRAGIADRVVLTSVAAGDRAGMAELLRGVRVVVSMSSFETHPIAALEAAAAGCRLVVARHSGLAELVADGLARGVPRRCSPRRLARIVAEELARPGPVVPPRLSTWDDCAAGLLDLYRSVACGS